MSSGSRKARIEARTLIIVVISLLMVIFPAPFVSGKSSPSNPLSRVQIQSFASSGLYFDHVVIILMENEGVYDICHGSPPPCNGAVTNATFLAGLANNYTIGSQYLSLVTTSQPNYVALISGSMQGCTSNGCPSPIKTANLVDRFEAAGLTWKGYFENMTGTTPGSCSADLNDGEPYTPIHNPFIVFQDVTNNTSRCNKLVNANPNTCGTNIDCSLVNDLNNATSSAPNFMWLTPNDCNDMRGWTGCGTTKLIQPGDTYLSKLVPQILNSHTFTTTRSALFITFDEGNKFCPGPNPPSEDCVYASWSGPVTRTKFGTNNLYSHYSFTKTIETNWNLTGFTLNDENSNPMAEFFKNQPADYNLYANPETQIVPTGVTANTTISATSFNNLTGTVSLNATSTPVGTSLNLNPASFALTKQGTGASKLTFSTSTVGNYTITLRTTSSSLTHTNTITIQVVPPDFSISASPNNLTIGQTSIGPGPTVNVTRTGDRTFFESSYLRSSFYAQGLIWLFYEDSRFTCEHMGGCLEYTTSTNGTNWANPTRTTVHITDNDFSVYTNGTSIFYVRYNETSADSTCGRKVLLGIGTLASNGIITWQPEQTIFQGAANRAYPEDEILVDSNNQIWIGYMMDTKTACGNPVSSQRPEVIHSLGTNYSAWAGNMTICTASCSSRIYHISLTSLGNGQVYSLYWTSRSGTGLHGRIYNGTGITGWAKEETISTDSADVNAWLFNNSTNLYALYFDNNTETFDYATRSMIGKWTINTIGIGETHTGTTDFIGSYYALPDTASYDPNDNLFTLFYLNGTNQRIDQWTGSGNTWTKNTGIVNTAPATYPDSINSFIQSTPSFIGELYYITGTATFTINSIRLSVIPAGNSGTFTVTIKPTAGFTSTVTLNETVTPSTGLAITCSPSTLPGGSGSSTCNLTSSLQGNYNVTVAGTSGSLSHLTIVAVRVIAFPDFSITATSPNLADTGAQQTSTITVTSINGFAGTISLTDTIPFGLSCGPISPSALIGSGTSTIICIASSFGNYTTTIIGTSGSLTHSAPFTIRAIDFAVTSSTLTLTSQVGTNATAILTLTGLNGYLGNVTLAATTTYTAGIGGGARGGGGTGASLRNAPPALGPTVSFNPATLQVASTITSDVTFIVSLNVQAGNYTIAVFASDGTLNHLTNFSLQITDFQINSIVGSLSLAQASNSTQTIGLQSLNQFQGAVTLSVSVSPSGPSAFLNQTTLNLSTAGNMTQLTISVPPTTLPGNYTVTVTAISGTLNRAFTINLTVHLPGLGSILVRAVGSDKLVVLSLVGLASLAVFFPVTRTQNERSRSKPAKYPRHSQDRPVMFSMPAPFWGIAKSNPVE